MSGSCDAGKNFEQPEAFARITSPRAGPRLKYPHRRCGQYHAQDRGIENRFRLFLPRLLIGKPRMNAPGPAAGNSLSLPVTDTAFFLKVTVEGRQVRDLQPARRRRLRGRRQVRDDNPPPDF